MRLTGESARAKELFEEGEFILAKTDLTMAATPKQLYDRWQRAVKKGYKQKINIDEYWEGLIIAILMPVKRELRLRGMRFPNWVQLWRLAFSRNITG